MAVAQDRYRVSIVRVREQDTFGALEEAITLISGIDDLVSPDSTVVVKPNFTMGPTEHGITNPVVLEAVLRALSTRGVRHITIGEGAGASYTSGAFRAYNVYDMATRYGAQVLDLNVEPTVRRRVPEATGRRDVLLPRAVAEADVLVSVPTYKLWGANPVSLSLKNLFGLYPGRHYGYNKDSRESAPGSPGHYLDDEIGDELGIHQPTVDQPIAAINLARPSDLTVIDALEGSNGKGDFVRLDLLMVGKNALATDCVAMALGGFVPGEQGVVQVCSEAGIGPSSLDDIDILGESLESVRFPLMRLQGNVLELPARYCLDRLSLGELRIIAEAQDRHGLADGEPGPALKREALLGAIEAAMTRDGYIAAALESLPEGAAELLRLIVAHGGTQGELYDVKARYAENHPNSDHFWASLRAATRLGLAFLFHGQYKCYFLLAEGVSAQLA